VRILWGGWSPMSLQEACGAAYTVDKGKRFKWNAGYFGASPTWNKRYFDEPNFKWLIS